MVDGERRGGGETEEAVSEEKCPVCLVSPLSQPSRPEACEHRFCLPCIQEWSRLKPLCPLCKAAFGKVEIVDSGEVWKVPPPPPGDSDVARRFGYRSALSGERLLLFEHISRMQMDIVSLQRSLANKRSFVEANARNPSFERRDPDWQTPILASIRDSTRLYRRRSEDLRLFQRLFQESEQQPRHVLLAHPSFRRFIYTRNIRVRAMEEVETPEERMGQRDSSADFLRANPALLHRLQAFLALDLSVLLRHDPGKVERAMERVLALLTRFDSNSSRFRAALAEVLGSVMGEFAEQLAHELFHFARSPHGSVEEYFRHAVYHNDDEEIADLRSVRNSAGPEIEVIGGAIRGGLPPTSTPTTPSTSTWRREEGNGGDGEWSLYPPPRNPEELGQISASLHAMVEQTRERVQAFAAAQASEEHRNGVAALDNRLHHIRQKLQRFENLRQAATNEDVEEISSDVVMDLPDTIPLQRFRSSSEAVQRLNNLLRRSRARRAREETVPQEFLLSSSSSSDSDDSNVEAVEFLGEASQPTFASRQPRATTPDAPVTTALRDRARHMAEAIRSKNRKKGRGIKRRHRRFSSEGEEERRRGGGGEEERRRWLPSDEEESSRSGQIIPGGPGFMARLARAKAPPGPFAAIVASSRDAEAASQIVAEDLRTGGALFVATPTPERMRTPDELGVDSVAREEEVSTTAQWNNLSDDSDLEVLADLKPKHLRTPPMVTLDDDEEPAKTSSPLDKEATANSLAGSEWDETLPLPSPASAADSNEGSRKRRKKSKKEKKHKRKKRSRTSLSPLH